MDQIRVLRVVEIIGPRDAVEKHLMKVLKGTHVFGSLLINVSTIGDIPFVMPALEDTTCQCGEACDISGMEGSAKENCVCCTLCGRRI